MAYVTGYNQIILDDGDPFQGGAHLNKKGFTIVFHRLSPVDSWLHCW